MAPFSKEVFSANFSVCRAIFISEESYDGFYRGLCDPTFVVYYKVLSLGSDCSRSICWAMAIFFGRFSLLSGLPTLVLRR